LYRDIWRNVIIVCKQSRNPEDDAQGAIGAARQFNPSTGEGYCPFKFLNFINQNGAF